MPALRIDDAQRRARLAVRHRLAPEARVDDVTAVADSLVVLHATDPASVFLAAGARMHDPSIDAVERALYDDRSLVRMLGMRRTMFVVPLDLVSVVQAACAHDVLARERRVLLKQVEEAGIATDPERWLTETAGATFEAIVRKGEATGSELSREVEALQARIKYAEGKPYGGEFGVTTRILSILAAEGRIVRGRPRGTWLSSLYRWTPMASWLPAPVAELPVDEARVELVRRWLQAFGPALVTDIKWWTGWSLGETRKALAALDTVDVELDAGAGIVLASDVGPVTPPEPAAALLPGLDPTPMGWAERSWYLGPHKAPLFDTSGNIGLTVWWSGRIVGGWAQQPDGEIVYRLLEDIGGDGVTAVEAEVVRMQKLLGSVRVSPRFRTPLERELAS